MLTVWVYRNFFQLNYKYLYNLWEERLLRQSDRIEYPLHEVMSDSYWMNKKLHGPQIEDKLYILDRTKGSERRLYYLTKTGHNVYVKAHAGKTHLEKLRIVFREFVVCEQFLRETSHQPIVSRGPGVFNLPHLVYEVWLEDNEELRNPQQYVVMSLKPGTVIPASTLEEIAKQEEASIYC